MRDGAFGFFRDYITGTVGHSISAEEAEIATITARDGAVVGSPDDAIAQIRRFQEVTGGFGGFAFLFHEWTTQANLARSYELFARHIMPAFQGQLQSLQASNDWLASSNSHIFGQQPDVMRRAFQDGGVELPEGLRLERNTDA